MSGASPRALEIVMFALSVTSSWGNGHATTYRALIRALVGRGHQVHVLERDVPWYASHRDLPVPPWGHTTLYHDMDELRRRFPNGIHADLIMLGSFVPDGVQVARWLQQTASGVLAFYDIDTPVTVAALERGNCPYLEPSLIPGFDAYFTFAGGPVMQRLQREFGARRVEPLYCSVDPEMYRPRPWHPPRNVLGYLGTYSTDRQDAVEQLLLEPARRLPSDPFIVAGALYPDSIQWPENVVRVEHCPPNRHREFYTDQQYTLNVTRADMVANGWSPSVRLFEAAACGTPIISDDWMGLEAFFEPGRELLVAHSTDDVLRILRDTSATERHRMAARARARVLTEHTAACRAESLEHTVARIMGQQNAPRTSPRFRTVASVPPTPSWSVPW